MPRSTLPLVALAALTFFVGLGRGAITDSDEAFYAEAAHEMVASGDWVTPRYNFENRFQKPVLYYWLTAASYLAAGESETTARLGAAMSGLGLVLLTAACGRRWYDDRTALVAGAVVATNFGYFSLGRMALPDLPLAFFITLAIWASFVATLERPRAPRRWVLLAAWALALGFLTKGPVGVAIPALVVLPVLLIERRSFAVGPADMAWGLIVLALVAAPWYVAMWLRHGTEYLQSFFVADNLERFATDRFNDPRPWWFYFPVVGGGLLPWTPLALVWVDPLLQFLRRRRDVSAIDVRMLLWAALPLVFFTLSVGKQPRYVLPVLPPLALLLASSIVERTREWRGVDGRRSAPRRATSVVLGALICGAFFLVVAGLLVRLRLLFGDAVALPVTATAAVLAVSGLGIVAVSLSRAWRLAPAAIAIAAAVALPTLQYGALSSGGDAVAQVARAAAAERRADEPVGTYGVFVRNLVYYTGAKTTDLITDDQARDFLAQEGRALLVAPADAIDRLDRDRGVPLRRLAELSYFNPAGVRLRTLLEPDPRRDLQRVVLAVNK
jgi:4-amino-4-deoxy-L-arabinose transferase-like glycosyltransferase